MTGIPTIRAVMTPFPYSLEADQSVVDAEAMMASHGLRHLPVTDRGEIVGVLTERDIFHAVNPALDDRQKEMIRVRQICRMGAFIVDTSARLDHVLQEMAERQIGSALVARKDKLVGIFTVTDACQLLAETLRRNAGNAENNGGDDDVA